MRIALNSFFLQRPATGSAEHLYGLLEGLDRIDETNEYLLMFPRLEGGKVLRMPHLRDRFQTIETTGTSARLGMRLGKIWWEQIALRDACAANGADILHSPYFASPLFPNMPTVVTIHDVITLVLPEYGRALHTRIYNRLVSAAARRARAILTVSEAAKRDIVRVLGIAPSRVHVAYNAPDPNLRPISDVAAMEEMRDRYGIAGDYILYFGGFDARKNVERVVRAYHAARSSFSTQHRLVLAGSMNLVGHPLYPDPRPLVRELGLEGSVIVTGRVSEADKQLLFSGATAFVFPSLYEGFGIPVLEAMACGAPVITSTSSSLPEVAGDAALLVDPNSVDEIARAMVRLVNDPSEREELRGRGLRRASDFSWQDSAQKTLEVYRQVAS